MAIFATSMKWLCARLLPSQKRPIGLQEADMQTTSLALAGYIFWSMTLTLGIAGMRGVLMLTKHRAINSFGADGKDAGDIGTRLSRAHANCYESFPIVGGAMLLALTTGLSEITDGLALWILGARLAQSIVHIASTSPVAVNLRFLFFGVQLGVVGYWLWMMVGKFAR
jgi:uncharacterized MAPEG superfamily protein